MTEGLAGISVGNTSICSVEQEGAGLYYRGYNILELVTKSSFDEVLFLLVNKKLPLQSELEEMLTAYNSATKLETDEKKFCKDLPSDATPMALLRTMASYLGCIYPENEDRLTTVVTTLAKLVSMLFYHQTHHQKKKSIETYYDVSSIAEHILTLLLLQKPTDTDIKKLDTSLILYAEHEFNASTFAARVCVATENDYFGPLTSAIATLAGPLHGGANEQAMYLIDGLRESSDVQRAVKDMLSDKKKIMGFGHRVYKTCDPRSLIIKNIAKEFETREQEELYLCAEKIEETMMNEKGIFSNLDFYSSLVYNQLGFSVDMFTPLFVFSRISGWSAHIFEQRDNNRLIRPNASYTGPSPREYIVVGNRG